MPEASGDWRQEMGAEQWDKGTSWQGDGVLRDDRLRPAEERKEVRSQIEAPRAGHRQRHPDSQGPPQKHG